MVLELGFSRVDVGSLLMELERRGIGGVIIGSTVYQILLKWRELEDDVDVFATSFSPSFDEDVLLQAAEELHCLVGQNDWGMPQLRCPLRDEELSIEFFENLYDFYVPQEIIDSARRVRLGDYGGKAILLEDYLLLKAKAGRSKDIETLWFISDLLKSRKLKINKELIQEHIKLFDYDDAKLIKKRLKEAEIIK